MAYRMACYVGSWCVKKKKSGLPEASILTRKLVEDREKKKLLFADW